VTAVDHQASSVGSLSGAVLDEEARRQDARGQDADGALSDQLFPGVGKGAMSLRGGLAAGGAFTFVVLLILNSLDELETAALALLAPDIRDSLGVSDGAITFIASASAAFIVLGAFPMGWLADRFRRGPIIGIASLVWTGFVFLTGLAANAFTLFWIRFGVGIAKANTMPVHGSLIADTYPVSVRGRLAGTTQMAGRAVGAISPLAIAGIVVVAGGDEGWRWAFFVVGIPVAVFALLAFRLPEPPRGQWEKRDVLAEVIEDTDSAPVSLEAAFARLMRIRTLKTVVIAFSAIGFVVFTLGVQSSLFLEDEYGLGVLGRGIVTSAAGVAAAIVLPFMGARFDRTYREDPARALRLIGMVLFPVALLVPIQFSMPNPYLFGVFDVARVALSAAAFGMVGPIAQAIIPYRLRGLGMAIITIYVFFVGAVGGALLAALLIDAFSVRLAVSLLSFVSITIGASMLLRGSRFIRNDLSQIVDELREEMDEHERRSTDASLVPALQVSHVDFSYGAVQVLFDVSLEVEKGETLALLGTNGAGKSTLLKVVAGLATPERGVVRLDGRNITFSTPEQRGRLGIQMLPGGRATFPDLSIHDNLVVGAYVYRKDADDVARRIGRVMELFPALAEGRNVRACDLSGGQQQMLGLARVMLHDPEVLLIDELSLGLAPTVVQDLLEMVDALRAAGQTMVIVEQSLNLALAVADRAVFLEKGAVRFEGPAQELAERDDLARAVFLGSDPAR
jgi:ABC-type branched-subunit amino acid transport system ATPase component/predicted MFS family arabinose efflux permease